MDDVDEYNEENNATAALLVAQMMRRRAGSGSADDAIVAAFVDVDEEWDLDDLTAARVLVVDQTISWRAGATDSVLQDMANPPPGWIGPPPPGWIEGTEQYLAKRRDEMLALLDRVERVYRRRHNMD